MIRIKKEASIGELLTGISLTITVIGLFFAWNKEKEIEIQKQAHEIRETYISINSRIDYWQNLNLHFYDKVDEVILETTIVFRDSRDMIKARGFFWKSALAERNDIDRQIFETGLEPYHLELLSMSLDLDSTYLRAVKQVSFFLRKEFENYIEKSAKEIEQASLEDANQTAILGNKLRKIKTTYQNRTNDLFQNKMADLRQHLHLNINKSDKELTSN
ncbi:hypothetical protein [Ekhidna sp.]|uniref:hypothetical protein n=1 Tax=Ekhidna sp. TaxID=2608089 RepID=UPI003B5021B8